MSLSPFSLRTLPDHALLEGLRALSERDCGLEADLLVHLGEVEARGLHAAQGFKSLFAYCVEVLHFSESVAWHRIAAARAARSYPLILERVRSGELHLSGLRLLLPHLTQANHVELLDLARHKSKRAIEELLADRAPKPDAPVFVRRVVERPAPSPAPPGPSARDLPSSTPTASRQEIPRPAAEPLGESRYKIQFTAGPAAYAKLREAQALLRHQIPDGDVARIFERGLEALLREARRTKFAETSRPRAEREAPTEPASRHIPAAIKRAVVARDGERCTFVAHGRRCGARDALEFHHLIPFEHTKRHRVEEITLRCRAHNAYAAVQDFGPEHMAQFRRRERASTSTCPGASSDIGEERLQSASERATPAMPPRTRTPPLEGGAIP